MDRSGGDVVTTTATGSTGGSASRVETAAIALLLLLGGWCCKEISGGNVDGGGGSTGLPLEKETRRPLWDTAAAAAAIVVAVDTNVTTFSGDDAAVGDGAAVAIDDCSTLRGMTHISSKTRAFSDRSDTCSSGNHLHHTTPPRSPPPTTNETTTRTLYLSNRFPVSKAAGERSISTL